MRNVSIPMAVIEQSQPKFNYEIAKQAEYMLCKITKNQEICNIKTTAILQNCTNSAIYIGQTILLHVD